MAEAEGNAPKELLWLKSLEKLRRRPAMPSTSNKTPSAAEGMCGTRKEHMEMR